MIEFDSLYRDLSKTRLHTWVATLSQQMSTLFAERPHGKMPEWQQLLQSLPPINTSHILLDKNIVTIGNKTEITTVARHVMRRRPLTVQKRQKEKCRHPHERKDEPKLLDRVRMEIRARHYSRKQKMPMYRGSGNSFCFTENIIPKTGLKAWHGCRALLRPRNSMRVESANRHSHCTETSPSTAWNSGSPVTTVASSSRASATAKASA